MALNALSVKLSFEWALEAGRTIFPERRSSRDLNRERVYLRQAPSMDVLKKKTQEKKSKLKKKTQGLGNLIEAG